MGKVKDLIGNKQFLSLLGNVVFSLLNLGTGIILARYMDSKADVGIYYFFVNTFNLIDTFRTGLLQTAFIKFFAGADKQRANAVLGSTWFLGILITLAICLITWPGMLFLDHFKDVGVVIVIKWIGITFISTLPMVIASWLLQAENRYREILYIRCINQLTMVLMVLWLIWHHQLDLYHLLVVNLISNILGSGLAMVCRWSGVRAVTKNTAEASKEIYHFGKFSFGTSISSNLLRYSDTAIIETFLGHEAMAVYGIAQTLMNIMEIPLRSFVTTAMTSLSAAQNNSRKTEVEYIFQKYTGSLTILLFPVAIVAIVFADWGIYLLWGNRWSGSEAANIFRIFMLFAIFFPIDRFTGVTLDVIHKPKINFYKVTVMLAINVVGDFAGYYLLHSIYGIALASVPTFIIGAMIGYFSLKKYLNFNFIDMLKLGWEENVILLGKVSGKLAAKLGSNK